MFRVWLSNGSVADKLRLASAGFETPAGLVDELMSDVRQILNNDGGIPFGVTPGSPSSVKETAEILALIAQYKS